MSNKCAFFDFDGTLVTPWFYDDNGNRKMSFTTQEWINFCNRKGDCAYEHARPIMPILQFSHILHTLGYENYILTVSHSHAEQKAKQHFVNSHAEFLSFENLLVADCDANKFDIIQDIICYRDIEYKKDVVLVEDTFSSVMRANDLGYVGYHTSHVFDLMSSK